LTGPIVVTALFGHGDNGWLQQLRRAHYPAHLNRVPAHLTLLRQLPPSAEQELSRRLAQATASPPPHARVIGIMDLGEGTALEVSSPGLAVLREDLVNGLTGLLTPQDLGAWRAHVTIQNKVTRRAAIALQMELERSFETRPLQIAALASWRYQAGQLFKLKTHSFRG
jgi:hypothetical protein